MPEWGNPAGAKPVIPLRREANGAKQNILVAPGKEINRDALSSGERTGQSLNPAGAMAAALARGGSWDASGGVRRLLGELQNSRLAEVRWNAAP